MTEKQMKMIQMRKKELRIEFEDTRLDKREPNFKDESGWELLALYDVKDEADNIEVEYLKELKTSGFVGVVQLRRIARDGITELRRSIEVVYLAPDVLEAFNRWRAEFNVESPEVIIEEDNEF